jgi:hypothetical protein
VFGVFAGLRAGVEIEATAASVLVAIVFGVATVALQRQAQRRQATVGLVSLLVSDDRIAPAETWLADRALRGQLITEEIVGSPADRQRVAAVLDYYEMLSVLARRGLVDVGIVIDLAGGGMTWAFHQCRPYIDYRRANDSPWLYSDLESFVLVYERKRGASQHKRIAAAQGSAASSSMR